MSSYVSFMLNAIQLSEVITRPESGALHGQGGYDFLPNAKTPLSKSQTDNNRHGHVVDYCIKA